jgi:hypothetical protein
VRPDSTATRRLHGATGAYVSASPLWPHVPLTVKVALCCVVLCCVVLHA